MGTDSDGVNAHEPSTQDEADLHGAQTQDVPLAAALDVLDSARGAC